MGQDTEHGRLQAELMEIRRELIEHKRLVEELQHRADIQTALNEVLSISLLPVSLEEQLRRILMCILHIPWLTLDEKGCVFLRVPGEDALRLVAHHNVGTALPALCRRVPFWRCLCGRAAVQRQLLFKSCVDAEHENRPEGMQPHGHYVLPVTVKGATQAVLTLYVAHGHRQVPLEREFLEACGRVVAGIIERKQLEERLERLSLHDDLTGLPNRRRLTEALDHALRLCRRQGGRLAVLFIDLDRFKAVNDDHGHETGDRLLQWVAERLREQLRETDHLARLGGDEFVAVLENVGGADKALEVAAKLIETVSRPCELDGVTVRIGASIGVALFPDHAEEPELLLRLADHALYRAKDGRGRAVLYRPEG